MHACIHVNKYFSIYIYIYILKCTYVYMYVYVYVYRYFKIESKVYGPWSPNQVNHLQPRGWIFYMLTFVGFDFSCCAYNQTHTSACWAPFMVQSVSIWPISASFEWPVQILKRHGLLKGWEQPTHEIPQQFHFHKAYTSSLGTEKPPHNLASSCHGKSMQINMSHCPLPGLISRYFSWGVRHLGPARKHLVCTFSATSSCAPQRSIPAAKCENGAWHWMLPKKYRRLLLQIHSAVGWVCWNLEAPLALWKHIVCFLCGHIAFKYQDFGMESKCSVESLSSILFS